VAANLPGNEVLLFLAWCKADKEIAMRWVTIVFGSLFILFGAALLFGGVTLVRLGGSSYYLITGIGLIASGIQLLRRRASGVWLYGLVVSGTLIWSLAESGLSMWGLLPRLATFVDWEEPSPRRSPGPATACRQRSAMGRSDRHRGSRDDRVALAGRHRNF